MKIYIIGSVASGKSTLAKKISDLLNIDAFALDDVVHAPVPLGYGTTKRKESERDAIFQSILSQECYIIEDIGRPCFSCAYSQVDQIIWLDLPKWKLKLRIILRFLKQKLGLEYSSYHPDFKMLKMMFIWVKDSPKAQLDRLNHVIILRNKKEIQNYLSEIKNNKIY